MYKPPDPEKAGNYPLMTLPGKEVMCFNNVGYEFDGKLPDESNVGNHFTTIALLVVARYTEQHL